MIESLKARILEVKSPIRWAILGFLLAFCLFFLGICLSCYSVYISLGRGVLVDISWWETFFLIYAFIFLGLFIIAVLAFVIGLNTWRGKHDKDESASRIVTIGKKIVKIEEEVGWVFEKLGGKRDEPQ